MVGLCSHLLEGLLETVVTVIRKAWMVDLEFVAWMHFGNAGAGACALSYRPQKRDVGQILQGARFQTQLFNRKIRRNTVDQEITLRISS